MCGSIIIIIIITTTTTAENNLQMKNENMIRWSWNDVARDKRWMRNYYCLFLWSHPKFTAMEFRFRFVAIKFVFKKQKLKMKKTTYRLGFGRTILWLTFVMQTGLKAPVKCSAIGRWMIIQFRARRIQAVLVPAGCDWLALVCIRNRLTDLIINGLRFKVDMRFVKHSNFVSVLSITCISNGDWA